MRARVLRYVLNEEGPWCCSFLRLQKGCDKLIVNMPDSDHGWCDSVVGVVGPWETPAEEDRRGCQHPGTLDRSDKGASRFPKWSRIGSRSFFVWTLIVGIGVGS